MMKEEWTDKDWVSHKEAIIITHLSNPGLFQAVKRNIIIRRKNENNVYEYNIDSLISYRVHHKKDTDEEPVKNGYVLLQDAIRFTGLSSTVLYRKIEDGSVKASETTQGRIEFQFRSLAKLVEELEKENKPKPGYLFKKEALELAGGTWVLKSENVATKKTPDGKLQFLISDIEQEKKNRLPPTDFVTISEAKDIHGVSRQRIQQLVQKGRIATVNVGGHIYYSKFKNETELQV